MRCDDVEVRLDCLRSGELEPAEKRGVEEHLGECRDCRELGDEIAGIAETAKLLMGECEPCCLETLEEELFDRYDTIETEKEQVHVAFSPRGITRVRLGGKRESFEEEYRARWGRELHCASLPEDVRASIVSALRGEGGEVEIDLSRLAPFERKVLEALLRIPRGEVRTYGWVAREVGSPAASRAVGNACARNPVPFVVPCHRVVPAGGGVGSYGYGPAMKRVILRAEGVDVEWLDELARTGIRYIGNFEDHSFCFPTCRAVEAIPERNVAFFHDAEEARRKGFEPCEWCRPLERAA
jgi:O-6-methylguanine DNA methyltransferase